MLNCSDIINFWRDEDVVDLNCPLFFIVPKGAMPRGDWPGNPPSLTTIYEELRISRMSYLRLSKKNDGKMFISLLSGRLIINGHVVEKNFEKKLFLNKRNGFEYACNKNRGFFISTGKRVRHQGIYCADSFMDEGSYTQQILDSKNIEILYEEDCSNVVEKIDLSSEEDELLNNLEQYIDSEFEIEQQTALSTPPFSYFNMRPESRNIVYRQFYRVDVNSDDLARMRELKVNLVTIETDGDNELTAEIVDISPAQEKDEIIISLEKQVPANLIPKAGLFRLAPVPTLKNVRKDVVERLRQKKCANSWLVPVAAGTYDYRPLSCEKVIIPPRQFPPNPSQIDALDRGAGADDYLLVLGPPGTGKTTVILDWVRHFVAQGQRVLITSQSNMAVDNVLERLAQEDDLQCVRLGNETKVSSAVRKILIDNFAINIQQSLIDRISDCKKKLSNNANELDGCRKKFPKIKNYKIELNKLKKEKVRYLKKADSYEMELNGVLCKLTDLSRTLEKYECDHRFKAARYQHRLNAKGFFSLISKALSRFDAFSLTRTEKTIAKIKNDIHQLDINKSLAEGVLEDQKKLIDEATEAINDLESAFRNFIDVSNLIIPELSLVSSDGLINFNEKEAESNIKKRFDQYQSLLRIVETWENVFSGERQRSIYQLLLSMVDVVGATCIGINTNRTFKDIPFDVVIVDESGQIQLHNLIVPLSRAPKAILVGDHKQLPPVVQEEIGQELLARDVDDSLYGKSWFEILWDKAPKDRRAMLDTQFRCPSSISEFVSKQFYDGKYMAGPNTGPEFKKPIFSFFQKTMVFIDTSHFPESKRREISIRQQDRPVVKGNPLETSLVLDVLERALAERPELASNNGIGIIVPYANHVKEIQKEIRTNRVGLLKSIKIPLNELVASVDSFQGQERDLIIMAFTRSNYSGSVGFLSDWRRLNVAMTRTKKQLVMVGDLSTLKKIDRRKGEHARDYEFKQAMEELEKFLKNNCQYIDAIRWTKYSSQPVKIVNKPLNEIQKRGSVAHV